MTFNEPEYDAKLNIVFSDLTGVRLDTRADIDEHLQKTLAWWRAKVGRKTYFVSHYSDFRLNLRESDYAAAALAAADKVMTLAAVRYGAKDPLQRAAARTRAMKMHTPSNMYATREEAIEVVLAIQQGRIHVPPG